MKKVIIMAMAGTMLFSSCRTTEEGAFNGAMFGSMVGASVGAITGGHRGYHMGKLAGLAGGAIIGGTAGANAEAQRDREFEARKQRIKSKYRKSETRYYNNTRSESDNSGFSLQGGYDDRIDINGNGTQPTGTVNTIPTNTYNADVPTLHVGDSVWINYKK